MQSRASLCELIAMKLLGHFATNQMKLIATLAASWSPLAGAPLEIMSEVRELVTSEEDLHEPQCALEMAIATESKHFLSSPVVQTIVNDIYTGRVVFSMTSHRSVLADNYKPRFIEIYDVLKAPFLDHYRLRVPKYGATLEFLNFVALLLLFLLCLSTRDLAHMNGFELLFIIFAAAFALEEYTASREHGWEIYIASLWNVFDTSFILIFLAYLGYRIKGLSSNNLDASDMAFDVLACGACILFPRLAFFAVSNNVVVLALRAMIADFIFFIGIAAICFSGLLFTLHSLASDTWSVGKIAWLMVQIWFGNTYLSFGQASSFHPLFGPILMTGFAALSNTLLLTILISILSNTFARIDANANQEYLFQFSITTIEGVKSDALFSYQPPFNLLAFLILWPLSFVVTPRRLHSINVFLIKLTSFPTLIIIGIYERYLRVGQKWRAQGSDAYNSFSRKMKNMPILEHIVGSSSTDIYEAIFDVEDNHSFHGLFTDSDEEDQDRPNLRSAFSQDSMRPPSISVEGPRESRSQPPPESRIPYNGANPPETPRSARGFKQDHTTGSPSGSPRPRRSALPTIDSATSGEIQTVGPRSPLSRLFTGRREISVSLTQVDKVVAASASAEAGIRRVETLVDDIKRMPINRLKEEMKELQERQARIENLLLMLTRGMRNETGHPSSFRHESL
ncbi:hypothetical protein QCA50_005660 [Cerrena zonata]|uniref:Polycystin cation channel PKD1/PKD2 domain-containing protein n=1 Tax=Cerrena zonata TaxID=2478898 RepID=A0AAW0GDR5_9APHY